MQLWIPQLNVLGDDQLDVCFQEIMLKGELNKGLVVVVTIKEKCLLMSTLKIIVKSSNKTAS